MHWAQAAKALMKCVCVCFIMIWKIVSLRALGQALHAGGFRAIPWEFQLPLLASNLPAACTQLVPAMRGKGDVACRAVAVPKHYEGECTTTCLVQHGRTVEHMICAHISGNKFSVHPGASSIHVSWCGTR